MSLTHAAQPGSAWPPDALTTGPTSPLGKLGSWSYRHRRLVAIAWVLALVVVSLVGRLVGSQFKDNLNGGTSTPSQQAAAFLQREFPSQAGDVTQVVFRTTGPITSAAAQDRITAAMTGLARLPRVASVLSPFAAGAAGQAFRSVVIPLVSAALTLLSTGAAYGVIVAVFQWGWLGGGIDNGATAPVDPWIPLMLFALLFGFSMDYQVFLISRIREEWRAGASDAVANGLARTGRIITSAAAIMICVFAAFVLGDLRVLRVIGLGMAVAVLLDATLVRMVATPAVLQLTTRANSWFPRRLGRGSPDFLTETSSGEKGSIEARPTAARLTEKRTS